MGTGDIGKWCEANTVIAVVSGPRNLQAPASVFGRWWQPGMDVPAGVHAAVARTGANVESTAWNDSLLVSTTMQLMRRVKIT
jgi:hypothetical protein